MRCQRGSVFVVLSAGSLFSSSDGGSRAYHRYGIHRVAAEVDPPRLNGSTSKYGFDHEGRPEGQTSDTSRTRCSRSFGRLRFCAAKAWRWLSMTTESRPCLYLQKGRPHWDRGTAVSPQ